MYSIRRLSHSKPKFSLMVLSQRCDYLLINRPLSDMLIIKGWQLTVDKSEMRAGVDLFNHSRVNQPSEFGHLSNRVKLTLIVAF